MTERELTAEEKANVAECKRLRQWAQDLHDAQTKPPELDAALLSRQMDVIDDAFGPSDGALIEAVTADESVSKVRGGFVMAMHGVSGTVEATRANAVVAWSIAARAAIKAGRT